MDNEIHDLTKEAGELFSYLLVNVMLTTQARSEEDAGKVALLESELGRASTRLEEVLARLGELGVDMAASKAAQTFGERDDAESVD